MKPPAAGLPCGQCRACLQIERMQYSDLAVVQAETEGATLKVEQIRDVQRSLSLAPYEGRYRVALFLRFQEAHVSAQNALLKTLEEAPAKVILLLMADTPESLLPTISSRCEILRLRPLRVERLEEALVSRWKLPSDEARLLAHLSGGRPGQALRLHEDLGELEQRREWIADLQTLLGSNRRFAYAEALNKGKDRARVRENTRRVYRTWCSYWRDVMLVSARSQAPLVNLDCEEEIRALAGQMDLSEARQCVSAMELATSRLESNVNMQLLTEVLLLDWPNVQGLDD
jgi:DNA polymerase-3 subunit delta'